MFLKYMEVQGFKSFPDKIKIELHPGITGIVGPNGSGKSNVSDAIRWVLGEQSAKSLRGGKMEDVIFAGTQDRKPMGFAEVSVCFDNTDYHFKIDYDEVLITRRYFRSGESEYYLNKAACRLKDIHELMMDTGMGRDGYSMVGQGKIDEIISAKPEDRRLIFEEAAGISKYRYRKQESERKMQQTGENLIRLLDIIGEIEGRLNPLERDAEKAKLYLKLRDELKENEISLSLYLLDDLKEKLAKTHEKLQINQKDLENAHENITAFEHRHVFLSDAAKQKQSALEALVEKTYAVKNEISSSENKIRILDNSKSFNVENINRIRAEIEACKEKCIAFELSIEQNRALKAEADTSLSALNETLHNLQTQVSELGNNSAEDLKQIEAFNQAILSAMQACAEYKADLSAMNAKLETGKTRLLSIDDDTEIAKEDVEIAEKRMNTECTLRDQLSEQLLSVKANSEALQAEYKQSLDSLQAENDVLQQLKISLDQAKSKQKMLLEMENAMDGYAHSVKSVIQSVRTQKLTDVTIYGTVSSVIRVKEQHTLAIEVALGNSAQNIITQTEEDAKEAITYLKNTRNGRATFLPISSVKGKKTECASFAGSFGFVGVAADLVQNEQRYDGIIAELLGRTLVFENLDQAIRFSKKEKQRYRLVTLDGEIIAAGGAITGGNFNQNTGFLSRKGQIEKLKEKCTQLSTQITKKNKLIEEQKLVCESMKNNLATYDHEIQLLQNNLFKANYNFEHYQSLFAQHKSELSALQKDKEELLLSCKQLEAEMTSKQYEIQAKEKNITSSQTALKMLQDKNNDSMSETAALNGKIAKLQIDIANIANDIRGYESTITRLNAELDTQKAEMALKNAELSDSGNAEGNYLQKIEEIEQEIAEKEAKLTDLNTKIEEKRIMCKQCEEDIASNQSDLKNANEKVVTLSQEQVRIENQETRRQAEFDSITNRMWEDYELTYISAQPLRKELTDIPETQKLVTGLKNQIKALGNINISAIDELAELKERHEFLSGQRRDMETAKETLSKIIDDMEILMTKQFTEQLSVINETFKRVFRHLFNGGTAELVLSNPEDVLTSGVEIIAQPPGKKLQNMTLFSGGEKAIIAISLLFALLEVRPSPLCILDEIEAALDDVNVARFASYLRTISTRSQIAIITHRRGTMEEADRLYGVTMQEKGVSKLLQLDIDEIEQKILKK